MGGCSSGVCVGELGVVAVGLSVRMVSLQSLWNLVLRSVVITGWSRLGMRRRSIWRL